MKNESSNISIKSTCHRAQKDISEVLEQLFNLKDVSEAQRVFYKNEYLSQVGVSKK